MTGKRFLNILYENVPAKIDTRDMEDFSEVEDKVQRKYGLVVGAAYIQLWNLNDTPPTQLDDLKDIKALPDQYYKTPKEAGALFLTVQLLPSFASRQTAQFHMFNNNLSPPALSDFWNAFKACTTPIVENNVIQLPNNIFILGNQTLGSSIFIRHCYPKLLHDALSIIETHEYPHLVILGNPGIGKTYFGYVLLLELARSGATVVYQSGKAECRYLFCTEGVFKGRKDDYTAYLDISSTFYIVDATTPVDVAAKTILLSSPRRDVWYKFSNDHCTRRYMPVWSEEEIELCRAVLFSNLPQTEVKSLYDRWGGIPRYVLENARNMIQQRDLDDAITAFDLDWLVKAIGNAEASEAATHRLIHLHVASDFCTRHYLFASEYVADQVYLQLYKMKREELLQFLSVSGGIGDIGVLRGVLFERHAHTVIANGGKFRIRELIRPKPKLEDSSKQVDLHAVKELELPRLEQLVFDNDLEVQSANDSYYYRPRITNYESVDSFEKPNLLFQMTCASKHPCKQAGIHKVLNLLGNPSNPSLYFVVPIDRFSDFKYQKFEDAQGKPMQEPTYADVKKVKQFVLAIELTGSR
ncbi:hypothetical protein HK103_007282 [Boothiomyces macroporosus]|uniref:Crinkler (CRN) family protein n=1 Tax=Boothiomyces macroporosus TaxID=261099 RepID=A0AAD5UG49_9FUNG|nr:hypothetical protein HK103_007281 [Boothiomyces macroporosus]KAJ3254312.1 hypothetical protein HK103_007282 [Boothiomyces macroporosus]